MAVKKYKVVSMGTLYLDATPRISDGIDYDGESTINIGDGIGGHYISWVKPTDMELFVSTSVIMCNVSWEDLDKNGFVKGKIVSIDGKEYLCRLVHVDTSGNQKDEWRDLLTSTFAESSPWDTKPYSFWTDGLHQITYKDGRIQIDGILKGGDGITSQVEAHTALRCAGVGFRPVLEPVQEGRHVVLEGQDFIISLPTGGAVGGHADTSEWNRMVAASETLVLGPNNPDGTAGKLTRQGPVEWLGRRSICMETYEVNTNKAVCRGGSSVEAWDKCNKKTGYGFRPKLIPVRKIQDRFFLDDNVYANITIGTVVRMYTLLQDGEPVKIFNDGSCSSFTKGKRLTITDEYFDEEFLIPWIVFDGKAVAQKNILFDISWDNLHEQEFC